MAEPKTPEKSLEDEGGVEKRKRKKERKDRDGAWAEEGPRDPFEMINSLPEEKQQEIQRALHLFSLGQGPPKTMQQAQRHTYRFWSTQPMPKIDEEVTTHGPIEEETPSVREEPYSLPQGFSWDTLDLGNPTEMKELCGLLNANYIEEDDNTLLPQYSPDFLLWALCPPGWQPRWHCGVRVDSSRKLVGFIGAIPATVRIYDTEKEMAEVNFLCVHKKLRSRRVAPVLIREITRRVQLQGILQAVYTASPVLPKPVAASRYWHRSLNPRKLIEVNFYSLSRNMTLQRALKLNRLPETPKIPGLRPMTPQDVPTVKVMLQWYLRDFHLTPVFSLEEVEHWLLPRDDVIDTYVVESPEGAVTDLVSFYTLSSAVLNHPVHCTLKAAYSLYTIHTATPLPMLLEDALVIAKARGYDVFTALDVMDNRIFLEPLRFSMGSVSQQYYLYNWRCPSMDSDKVGLVLK